MTAAAVDVLTGHGLSVRLPQAWEGRISLRPRATAAFSGPVTSTPTARGAVRDGAGAAGWLGEDQRPTLHLADFPLPAVRGDFGSGALEQMPDDRAFVALLEYGPGEVGTPLFAPGRPRPAFGEFSKDALQRRIRGQLGWQRFFTENDRAFCLYVVLGTAGTAATVRGVNDVVEGIEVA